MATTKLREKRGCKIVVDHQSGRFQLLDNEDKGVSFYRTMEEAERALDRRLKAEEANERRKVAVKCWAFDVSGGNVHKGTLRGFHKGTGKPLWTCDGESCPCVGESPQDSDNYWELLRLDRPDASTMADKMMALAAAKEAFQAARRDAADTLKAAAGVKDGSSQPARLTLSPVRLYGRPSPEQHAEAEERVLAWGEKRGA